MKNFAHNISRQEVRELKELPPNTVLILINEPDATDQIHLKFKTDRDNNLRISFWDIRGEFKKDGKLYGVIPDKTANEIIKFIYINKDKNFIVSCQAGISRSAAVVLYINTIYGHSLKNKFFELSAPNELVLGRFLLNYKKNTLLTNQSSSGIINGQIC
jgi:predicted protein tyrosine phosphatase